MYEYLSVQKFQTLGFYYKPILIKKKIEFYIIFKRNQDNVSLHTTFQVFCYIFNNFTFYINVF